MIMALLDSHDQCITAITSLFRGRITPVQPDVPPSLLPLVHSGFSMLDQTTPFLVVIGLSTTLNGEERAACALGVLRDTLATRTASTAAHAVCTDGTLLEVFRLNGAELSLTWDARIEHETPAAFGSSITEGKFTKQGSYCTNRSG